MTIRIIIIANILLFAAVLTLCLIEIIRDRRPLIEGAKDILSCIGRTWKSVPALRRTIKEKNLRQRRGWKFEFSIRLAQLLLLTKLWIALELYRALFCTAQRCTEKLLDLCQVPQTLDDEEDDNPAGD